MQGYRDYGWYEGGGRLEKPHHNPPGKRPRYSEYELIPCDIRPLPLMIFSSGLFHLSMSVMIRRSFEYDTIATRGQEEICFSHPLITMKNQRIIQHSTMKTTTKWCVDAHECFRSSPQGSLCDAQGNHRLLPFGWCDFFSASSCWNRYCLFWYLISYSSTVVFFRFGKNHHIGTTHISRARWRQCSVVVSWFLCQPRMPTTPTGPTSHYSML